MDHLSQQRLDKILNRTVSYKYIFGAVFQVESSDHSIQFSSASGNMAFGGLYYIASINKLILSAIGLRLIRENKLNFSDKISNYIPGDLMKGLLVLKGKDYSSEITIGQLLSHTSGLPCYLIDKRPGKRKLMVELLEGKDQQWPTDKVIAQVKEMKPKFIPGEKGKASYSNTNFRILGKILEIILQKPLHVILNDLFYELEMRDTFVYTENSERAFAPFYNKEKPVYIPHYLASSGFDIISTASDQMIFLKAFFKGYFYPKEKLHELEKWNSIFFPFQYGIGIQKFYTPRIFSPFKAVPDMIGHCGSIGTAAFFIAEKDLFITGTINQAKNPGILFRTIIKIISDF